MKLTNNFLPMGLRRRRRSSSSSAEELLQLSNDVQSSKRPRVGYAKCKKPFGLLAKILMVSASVLALCLLYYTVFHFDHFHFCLVHFYAHYMDDHHAQHALGHKLLKDKTNLNTSEAFRWFRKSANKGHPHAAYNLVAGHLGGHRTDVAKGEVKVLLEFAAKNGVEEAQNLLDTLCKEKPKHCLH